ncbi:unnamed protein product [Adineta steineri]|uniref:NYN domain-containing protein n=1 Tax=Adineta steineri TaxID=433720 RepID=A0A814VBS7_9BILA|nr:unnamed protein product [Adineta steineri]
MSSPVRDGSNTSRVPSDIHIVVDNSNLFIGAQLGQGIDGQQDAAIRINVANLANIIEKDKKKLNIKTRIVGGSIPPRKARAWTEWEKCNYKCLLGDRSMNNKEVFLDDMLHAQIQKLILKNNPKEKHAEQNLILISGDGNGNDNRTSFPEVVLSALEHGWMVEVWSWQASLSTKFKDLQEKYPSKMEIKYFDTHRSKVTFKEKQKQQPQQQPQQQQQQQHTNPIQSWILLGFGLSVFLAIFLYYFKKS